MKNFDIVTLTVNPALDKSTHFRGLVPEKKIRCETPRFDAGGVGINVSKAIAHLGGSSKALFTSGGSTGKMLKEIIEKEGISFETIEIHSATRESLLLKMIIQPCNIVLVLKVLKLMKMKKTK